MSDDGGELHSGATQDLEAFGMNDSDEDDDTGDAPPLTDADLLNYEATPAPNISNCASNKQVSKKLVVKKDDSTGKMDTGSAETIPTQCVKNQLCCKKPVFASGKHLGFCVDANGKKLTGKEPVVKPDERIPVVEGTRVIAGRGMRSTSAVEPIVKPDAPPTTYRFGTDHKRASASAVKEADEEVRKAEEALLKAKKAKLEALAYEITVDERMISQKKEAERKK